MFAVTEPAIPGRGRLRDRIGEQDGKQAWEGRVGGRQGGWAGEGRMGGRMRGRAWRRKLGWFPPSIQDTGELVKSLDTRK